jgi:hypothetical protein
MSRIVSRAESFERAYEVFQQVNFSAFDFVTVKESMIEYVKAYFPEDFNDYIESSEFIAVLELFAYMAELISYRLDINAHENFITQAQRKESVLRLAKLISYKASRNIPARGFVKIGSIRTTENVFDTNGTNLANRQIRWNDPNNVNWKTQFLLIMNRLLEQPFGSVSPEDRIQVEDVVFELYQLENTPTALGVQGYSTNVSGTNVQMELVPVVLDELLGPVERHPERNRPFSLVFANDGLGDGSSTTGFLMFTKQGTMNIQRAAFDGITPNQTFDLANTGINNTDVYLNNVDPDTGELVNAEGRWAEVDTVATENIVFNTLNQRNKYEIETLDRDGVRLIFGDGEFANIPSGTFDIWHRVSLEDPLVIPQNSVVNRPVSFNYLDVAGNVQTVTFTFSLINSLQNAAASESIDHIRRTAPSTYFAQDRMVSGEDYNTFPLQDPSIAKLRALNRTFAGDSKYIPWYDPSETYENVKIFGNDLLLYYDTDTVFQTVTQSVTTTQILDTYIEPILSTSDFALSIAGIVPLESVRTEFTPTERSDILAVLGDVAAFPPETASLYYDANTDTWTAILSTGTPPPVFQYQIDARFQDNIWTITRDTRRIIAESPSTRFWNTNGGDNVVSLETLTTLQDEIVILNANVNPQFDGSPSPAGILQGNVTFRVLQQANDASGLPDITKLVVIPEDRNGDGVPDFDIDFDNDGNPDMSVNNIIARNRSEALDPTQAPTGGVAGSTPFNFAWFHYTPRLNLVDPAASNIIDMFILTQGYISAVADWVAGDTAIEPVAPTPLDLRRSYGDILTKKMISDTVVLRPGLIRLLFGDKAAPELQAQLKVIKSPNSTLTDNRIKTEIVDVVNEFFAIDLWEFGETFYFTELAAAIHQRLPADISSVVVVPTLTDNQFGDLFQVAVREDEVVQPDVTVDDIVIVAAYTDENLRLDP